MRSEIHPRTTLPPGNSTTSISCYNGELKPVVYILTATLAIQTKELLTLFWEVTACR